MSLIEKIDTLEKYLVKNNSYFEGAEWLFGKVREAILSEQKEPATDNNVVTIGDKIRESNESLAEFLYNITTNCITGKCLECKLYKACDREDNAKDIEDYLNQPYTDTIN